jgi:energy-converting hydrogenase Eha subunit A
MPPLRWGDSRSRAVAGGILIISGAIAVAGADTFVLWLLLLGAVVHIAGWCVMPASGWRRVVASVLSTPAVLLLLTGPRFIGVLVLPYIAWLVVRHRPARSFPTLVFVLGAAVILSRLYGDYSGMLPALGIEVAVMAASAWAARAVAGRGHSRTLPQDSP